MQNRKICLDTETTGLYVEQGERVFEIGCVELINDIRTGKTLQYYLNPEKPLSQESIEISGIKDEFLRNKPKFAEIVDEFLKFVGNSVIVAHNANFDIKFINNELKLAGREALKNEIIDSLQIARRKFPGQKASLDALCKRYNIDNSKRIFHGALLDADLLVDVYIQLIGGVEKRLIDDDNSIGDANKNDQDGFRELLAEVKTRNVHPIREFAVNDEDAKLHGNFIGSKIKNAIWLKENAES
jgi:DNA polymerase-3 subunit epsilon